MTTGQEQVWQRQLRPNSVPPNEQQRACPPIDRGFMSCLRRLRMQRRRTGNRGVPRGPRWCEQPCTLRLSRLTDNCSVRQEGWMEGRLTGPCRAGTGDPKWAPTVGTRVEMQVAASRLWMPPASTSREIWHSVDLVYPPYTVPPKLGQLTAICTCLPFQRENALPSVVNPLVVFSWVASLASPTADGLEDRLQFLARSTSAINELKDR